MAMHFLRFILILAIAPIALAQERNPAAENGVSISPADCARLASTSVSGAEYKPGVDVNGKPLVPADLPGSNAGLPEYFLIDIKRSALSGTFAGSDLFVGRATIDPLSGRVELNGKPLENSAEAALAAECARLTAGGG